MSKLLDILADVGHVLITIASAIAIFFANQNYRVVYIFFFGLNMWLWGYRANSPNNPNMKVKK